MTHHNKTCNTPFVHTYDSDQRWASTLPYDQDHRFRLVACTRTLNLFYVDSKGSGPIWWGLKLIWVFTWSGSTHYIVVFLTVWLLSFMSVPHIVHIIRNRAVWIVEYVSDLSYIGHWVCEVRDQWPGIKLRLSIFIRLSLTSIIIIIIIIIMVSVQRKSLNNNVRLVTKR